MKLRSHYCADVAQAAIGEKVRLTGWVNRYRDHGGLVFIDLRDRSGIVQLVFNPAINADLHQAAHRLRSEDVIAVSGEIIKRIPEMVNPKLATGEIEIIVRSLTILNRAETPPFSPADEDLNVGEDIRLKYRYLDMRTPRMARNLAMRHRASTIFRNYLDRHGFWEVETPYLTRSTPEGARDYLVPSRVNPGNFFALPQSPQQLKQILMIGGCDRYYQIARCFRDEDLRADRQPEFTQVDLELSFIEEDDIFTTIDGVMQELIRELTGTEIKLPINRLTYDEAMARFGSDKPDLRSPLELTPVRDIFRACGFKVFRQIIEDGGEIKALRVPGGAKLSRKDIDDLTKMAGDYGSRGLAWMKVSENGFESSIVKFFTPEELARLQETSGAANGDILFFVAATPAIVNNTLAWLRVETAQRLGLMRDGFHLLWVTDFPQFEFDPGENRWFAMHHPFTQPQPATAAWLTTDPGKVRARAYDIVLNGIEIGGGSIRIHDPQQQLQMFRALSITDDEIEDKFGHLMRALRFGAPPHGGIALGFDRILMLLLGEQSIRDVIPFPKTQKAVCPLTGAPGGVSKEQLRELHLRLRETEGRERG